MENGEYRSLGSSFPSPVQLASLADTAMAVDEQNAPLSTTLHEHFIFSLPPPYLPATPYDDGYSPPQIEVDPPFDAVQNTYPSYTLHDPQSHMARLVPQPSPDLGFYNHLSTVTAHGPALASESSIHSWNDSPNSLTASHSGTFLSASPAHAYTSSGDWSPASSYTHSEYEDHLAAGGFHLE